MKIAQALTLRKKMNQDIQTTAQLVNQTSVCVTGEPKPRRNPDDVLASMTEMMESLNALVQRIDATNAATVLRNGMTIRQAMARRKIVATHRETLAGIQPRRRESSIIVLDVSKLKSMTDDCSREWRELDDLIQEANWATELIQLG